MNNSNEKKARRVATLLAGYMRDTLTPAEHDELDEWVGASDKNMRLFEELTDEKRVQLALDLLNDNDQSGLVKKLKNDQEFVYVNRPFYKKPAFAIAASVVVLVGAAVIYFTQFNTSAKKSPGPIAEAKIIDTKIVPGVSNATLMLSDGRVLHLNNLKNGIIAVDGNSVITKEGNQIIYTSQKGKTQNIILDNILTTGAGEMYSVTMIDGTKFWMNPSSSISFHPRFSDNERRITMAGDVYFEVAKDLLINGERKPFIAQVKDKNMSVQVLGTHFGINAYSDEPFIKTTLAEGSVKVSYADQITKLKPNEQAQVDNSGNIKVVKVDAVRELQWKDGVIKVDAADLRTTLRKLGRWYNVEIDYSGIPNNPILTSSYTGTLSLQNSLEDNLKSLETNDSTTHTHFEIEGRKIIVTVTPS